MASWVVPAVAADLWGMSIEQVLKLIDEGKVAVKREGDFVLVDVAPPSSTIEPASKIRSPRVRATRPMRRELDPCSGLAVTAADVSFDPTDFNIDFDPDADDSTDAYDGATEPSFAGGERPSPMAMINAPEGECSWVQVRQQVSRRRVPPGKK